MEVGMCVGKCDCQCEWGWGCVSDWLNVGEMMSVSVAASAVMSEWMGNWWMSEWSECDWESERVSEWMGEWVNEWVSEWASEWMWITELRVSVNAIVKLIIDISVSKKILVASFSSSVEQFMIQLRTYMGEYVQKYLIKCLW